MEGIFENTGDRIIRLDQTEGGNMCEKLHGKKAHTYEGKASQKKIVRFGHFAEPHLTHPPLLTWAPLKEA